MNTTEFLSLIVEAKDIPCIIMVLEVEGEAIIVVIAQVLQSTLSYRH